MDVYRDQRRTRENQQRIERRKRRHQRRREQLADGEEYESSEIEDLGAANLIKEEQNEDYLDYPESCGSEYEKKTRAYSQENIVYKSKLRGREGATSSKIDEDQMRDDENQEGRMTRRRLRRMQNANDHDDSSSHRNEKNEDSRGEEKRSHKTGRRSRQLKESDDEENEELVKMEIESTKKEEDESEFMLSLRGD
jgi:hypothetical protein